MAEKKREVPGVSVVVDEDVWLEAGKEYFVRGKANAIASEMKSFIFVPNMPKLAEREILAAHAIVEISHGYCPVRLMCLAEVRTRLYKGTYLGTLEKLEHKTENCRQINEERCESHHRPSRFKKLKVIFQEELTKLSREDQERLETVLQEYADVFSC